VRWRGSYDTSALTVGGLFTSRSGLTGALRDVLDGACEWLARDGLEGASISIFTEVARGEATDSGRGTLLARPGVATRPPAVNPVVLRFHGTSAGGLGVFSTQGGYVK